MGELTTMLDSAKNDITIVLATLRIMQDSAYFSKEARAKAAFHMYEAIKGILKYQLVSHNIEIKEESIECLCKIASENNIIIPHELTDHLSMYSSWQYANEDMHLLIRVDSIQKILKVINIWIETIEANQ